MNPKRAFSFPSGVAITRVALVLALVSVHAGAQTDPPPMNLSRYMPATASSENTSAGGLPKYAVDGLVCEESRWITDPVNGPHWLQVDLGGSFQIGSANVVTGSWDTGPVANFSLQYWTGSAWVNIPGATITGNTMTQRQIVFSSPVTTTQVRFHSTINGPIAVKELAVFPPKNDGTAYPIGTEIDIRSGMLPMVTASSQNAAGQRPYLAYDGFVHDNSRWISANVTTKHWLEYGFVKPREIAYAHIYMGLGSGSAIANFHVEYWDGSAWVVIPGSTVTGNTSTEVFLTFDSTIRTDKVSFVCNDDGNIRIKEIVYLPPNGGVGYPRGTGVVFGAPPPQNWSGYSDRFYNIRNRVAGLNLRTAPDGTVRVENPGTSTSQQYNILLNIGTDTYRICNRANERCLEVAGGSLAGGALVREGDYNARPYQQWRLVAAGSYYKLLNVYSGLVLTVDGSGSVAGTGLVQQNDTSANTQQWSFPSLTHFPKKGVSSNEISGDIVQRYNASHYYNWSQDPYYKNETTDPTHHQPMWWGITADRLGRNRTEMLVLMRAEWAVSDVPKYLLGFNEPNHTDQSNMSVQTALNEWSRAEQVKLPLVGPQHDYAWGSWYTSFFDQADAIGMRIDEGGGHIYPTAASVNYDAFSSGVTDGYNAQNSRVQWVTELNWVNWGGAATWTDDELYSVLAETLWRYENNPWVKRYQWFAFSTGWANGAPGALEVDSGSRPILPLGRLYGAWDGDLDLRPNTWYHLHNRGTHAQLQNSAGAPANTTINTVDSTINWYLVPTGTGKFYIVCNDGMRLSSNGTTVSLVASGTTGTAVEWLVTQVAAWPGHFGWFYLDHPASGKRLDSPGTSGPLTMSTDTDNSPRWRFIKPYSATPAPGLLAQYRFEGNLADGSGMGNHATATGSPAYTAGPIGQAIRLDGVDDVVTAAIGLTDSADITVAAWVYWNGGNDWQRIFDFGVDTNNYMFLTPKAGGAGLRFAIKNGSSEEQLNAPTLPVGEWVHLAVTLSGDTGTLYVNGAAAATGNITFDPNLFKGTNHYIGKSQFADPLFNGSIDDFRVYNYALNSTDIAKLIPSQLPSGLVAHYKLDGNTQDSSGHGTHATAIGAPAYTNGVSGQAVIMDAVNDVVNVPAGIADSADITISAWVRWNGGGIWQRVFDFGNNTQEYMYLTPNSGLNTLRFAISKGSSGGEQALQTTPLATGQWIHLAVTLGGDTGTLYVNGTAVDTRTINLDPFEVHPAVNYIGKSQFADPLFNGAIDDFRIYNYALNAADIAGLAINPTVYASWASGYAFAPGTNDMSFDADKDGRSNAFEWLFGSNPLFPDAVALPEGKLRTVTGSEFPGADPAKQYLSISAKIRKNISGMTLIAQAASSPALLDASGSSSSIVSRVLNDLGDFEQREWIHTVPVEDAPAAFMRLKLIAE